MRFGSATMGNHMFPAMQLVQGMTAARTRNRFGPTLTLLSSTLVILALTTSEPGVLAQAPSSPQITTAIEGTLHDSSGKPVPDATVSVQEKSQNRTIETKTDANGKFLLPLQTEGTFTVTAEKSGFRKCVTDPVLILTGQRKLLDLLLQSSIAPQSSSGGIEFDDKPNFTVAGVTDWSGAGGHGSDTSLRTSEAFARETLALKGGNSVAVLPDASARKSADESIGTENNLLAARDAAPDAFETNHQLGAFYLRSGRAGEAIPPLTAAYQVSPTDIANALDLAEAYLSHGDLVPAGELTKKLLSTAETNADLHRIIGDLAEKTGDPLNAVREYERATALDPSELNYFRWGSELLLHRAVAPSVIVFKKGALAYPKSPRMRIGFGAALFAAGSFDDASRELCQASDLNPADATPYLFLGKMDITSPAPFPCIADKLARFHKAQPSNPLANYYLSMSITKRNRESSNPEELAQAQALLEQSIALNPNFGEAYLQLGILYAAQGASEKAVAAYTAAIQVAPGLSEPHYRLSQLYKRIGDKGKAEQEIKLYRQAEKTETDAVERQRRDVQQFLVILKDQSQGAAPR